MNRYLKVETKTLHREFRIPLGFRDLDISGFLSDTGTILFIKYGVVMGDNLVLKKFNQKNEEWRN